jgi:3-hydroxyacyl-CoA dehydrogenase / enoyl-CoA hydratase / 3-hydroxybutyryl-CoA epimerase
MAPLTEALSYEIRDGVAVLTLDEPGEPVNTLSPATSELLDGALHRAAQDTSVRAVVLISGKKDVFIAGADVKWLGSLKTKEDGQRVAREGQDGMDRLESFPKPIVAAIHGACLGGGNEVVLACTYRMCSDSPKTQLGQPEVQLGLLPGAGGTQRLPALIGIAAALDMILTGKSVRPAKARKLGLVDEVVPRPILLDLAIQRARALGDGTFQVDRSKTGGPATRGLAGLLGSLGSKETWTVLALEDNPLGRAFLFEQAKKQLRKKTHGHYPAPERALEAVRLGVEKGRVPGLEAEAEAFGELLVSDVSQRLREIFFATNDLKKDPGVSDEGVQPRSVKKVGVLGGGLMGGGIAYVTAVTAGLPVRIRERDDASAGRALAHVRKELQTQVERRRLTPRQLEARLAQVTAGTNGAGLGRAEVVIEAVFENLELKRHLRDEVEGVISEQAIFASNTSSLPIARIAEGAKRPAQVVGMHYFSPVEKMPLLEVVTHAGTAPWVTATAVALGKKQGKTVIVVKDGPGFYTSRILAPYLNEAAHLLLDGAEVGAVDEALVEFGFPVGPYQLLDEVGIDVGEKVSHILHDAFGERMRAPEAMAALVKDGRLGRKAKKGFYTYDGRKKTVDESVYAVLPATVKRRPVTQEEVVERCVYPMINEAVRCLAEGIVRSARDADIGAVFGLGFPPFRGGPFRFADALGAAALASRLESLAEKLGPRFEAAALLRDKAARGERFYP